MATVDRGALIRELFAEMIASTEKALLESKCWKARKAQINAAHGSGSTEAHVAAKEDLRLKEHMAAYQWHASHAGFCSGVIGTLMSEEVVRHVQHPGPRPRRS